MTKFFKKKPNNLDSTVVTGSETNRKPNVRRLLIGLVVVALILVATVFVAKSHLKNQKSELKAASAACTNSSTVSALRQASVSFNPANRTNLQETVTKIQAMRSYQQDPNCLFVVVNYYVDTSNPEEARHYLDLLNKTYNPKTGINPLIHAAAGKDVKALNGDVEFLDKLAKQIQSNLKNSVPQ